LRGGGVSQQIWDQILENSMTYKRSEIVRGTSQGVYRGYL